MMREMNMKNQREEEPVSFSKEIEPMTRAEWVEKARAECEKELEYYEDIRMQADFCRYVDLTGDEEQEEYQSLDEGMTVEEEESLQAEYEIGPEGKQEPQGEESSWENQTIYKPQLEFSYLSKFRVRLVAAALIALTVIAIDYFKVKTSVVDSDTIRTVIQKNDSIESVEDAITTFTQDKVLPIFQKD